MTDSTTTPTAAATTGSKTGSRSLPVAPTDQAIQRLRPLPVSEVRITGGAFGAWQRDNRRTSIPHGIGWIEREGVLDNFRRLIGESDAAERRGWVFADSDLYKMLEAMAWDLTENPDPDWDSYIRDATGLLERARDDDGYLNTHVQSGLETRFGNLARGHELYSAGHLIQAAVAHVRATGRDDIMRIARPFADYLVQEFLHGGREGTDGHPEIEMALVELYRETEQEDYLELARHLIDVRGHGLLGPGLFGPAYFQDEVPVRDQEDIVGHAVRALYLIAGMVDAAVESGDSELLAAAENQWSAMVAGKTYITGAVGSRFEGEAFGDAYELPPDLIYGETCASIAAFMASWRLLLATGRSRYADVMERILHNVLAGSTALSRDRFFYVNPVHRRRPQREVPDGHKPIRTDAPGERAEWFDVACCPPNVMRTIASLSGYLATSTDDGVQLHLYLPAAIDAEVNGEPVRLEVVTDYPVEGLIRVRVDETPTTAWALSLRVPDWARNAQVRVAGEQLPFAPGSDGYLVIDREWREGDEVLLELPLTPRLTASHPAVDAVRGTVAIERGPVVYCLERPQGAFGVNPEEAEVDASAPLREHRDDGLLGGVVVIDVPVRVRDDTVWGDRLWAPRDEMPDSPSATQIAPAIPYALWANRGPSQMRVWIPLADSINR